MTMITTIHGDTEESLLVKTEGSTNNTTEYTTWVEYRLPGSEEIVHRSVHMTLKEIPVFSSGAISDQ
jgi:hypothetical protein